MKKKLIASFIAASMLLVLSACGGKDPAPDSQPTGTTPTEQASDSEPVANAPDTPDDAVPDNAAPVNGIQLYDGSYLDLDGEYASGTPCRRMGGSGIAASDTTVSFIGNIGMNPYEEDYQEGVIAESYQWDVNVTNDTPFVGIPAGEETCWNRNRIMEIDIQYVNDKTEDYKVGGARLMEPGATNQISLPFNTIDGYLVTVNETSEPADIHHFSPIILIMSGGNEWENYDDDTSGKSGRYICIGGKAPHSFDDIITAYGEPMGVYGTKASDVTYVWKATGDTDVYVLVTYNAQTNNPSIHLNYIRDCEASRSYIADNGSIPGNLYDILSELGLYSD